MHSTAVSRNTIRTATLISVSKAVGFAFVKSVVDTPTILGIGDRLVYFVDSDIHDAFVPFGRALIPVVAAAHDRPSVPNQNYECMRDHRGEGVRHFV